MNWNITHDNTNSQIVNIVAVFNWKHNINLNTVHTHWKNSIYQKKKIPCVRLRFKFKHVNTVALVFYSGKIVVTGAPNIHTLRKAHIILNLFLYQYLHIPHITFIFQTANVIATAHLKQHINLTLLPHTTFDPQSFPAAIHKKKKAKATILFYSNGKIVVTGAQKIYIAHINLQYALQHILYTHTQHTAFNTHFNITQFSSLSTND